MIEVSAQITAVTVFPNRARITRVAAVDIPAGPQRVAIVDLPTTLHVASVRANARGTARAKLLGVEVVPRHYEQAPAEQVQALEAEIEALQDEDASRAGEAQALAKEREHLAELGAQARTFARALVTHKQTAEEQAGLYDFLAARARDLRARELDLAQVRREAARVRDRLQRELNDLRAQRPLDRYVAVVEFEVSAAGRLDVELTYLIDGVKWTPLYDLRLAERLAVTYLASVVQNTGEDWQGVELQLSTAFPTFDLAIPELPPWYIQPVAPPVMPQARMRGALMAKAAAPAAADMVMREEAEPVLAAEVATAEVASTGAAVTYRLPGRSDVPGNGEPRKVTVAQFDLEPRLDYVSAPKLAEAAYRRAKVTNASPYLLLPGQVQLFEENDYLGATQLELTAPGQEIELALGVDQRVHVKRELKQRDVDRALLGGQRRIHYRYTIEIENLTGAAQTLLVRDQLPVARHEQIKVRLDGATPKPVEPQELGVLEWKLSLADKAKTTITFEFTVEHPADMNVAGLV